MHRVEKSRRRWLGAGVVAVALFAVVGYAASLALTTDTLGAGSATVSACNATASVTYDTVYDSAIPGYKVTTAPITSAVACASMPYRLTLTGAADASLGEKTGTLDGSGAATPDFTADDVEASLVTGVQLVISG
jgi:hypothetical protein